MEFQAEIIRAIQSVASPALDVIFQCITVMGEELFLLPVAVLLFWCVNKELGYWICWCAAEGNLLVNLSLLHTLLDMIVDGGITCWEDKQQLVWIFFLFKAS